MSRTNPNKPKKFSFLKCAEDFELAPGVYKLPQTTSSQYVEKFGFLYHFLANTEDFLHSWEPGENKQSERIETITYFLLLNAAIEGEI